MASNAMKTPLVRHLAVRHYAQACPAPVNRDVKVVSSKLSNNTFIAAVDNGSPVTRVTVAFKGGARYEPMSEPGLTHVLRVAAGLTSKTEQAFIITRKLQQMGASINATVDREVVTYTLEVTQNNICDALKYLNALVCNQEFRPWELSDLVTPRLKYDIVSLPPQVRAVDLLHKAAYRRGLGNSLFISPRRIGNMSSESLQHYVANNFTAGRCAVTIVGGNQDLAKDVAQSLELGSGKSDEAPTCYASGELRKEMGGELAHIAMAVEGAKAGTPESLALAVAAKALGNGPSIKWGADHSPLAKAVGNVGPYAAAGFNVSYSDSGLFGVVLSVPKDEACTAVKAVAGLIKSGNLSDDAIKAGKNLLKVQLLSEWEDNTGLAESLAIQGVVSGTAISPKELAEQVEKLSPSDVSRALSSVAKGKLTIGAAGNLLNVPYVNEI